MKKILAVSALVSLIPLASISIVSCKKNKTETNSGDNNTGGGNNNTGGGNNNTGTPEGNPSIPVEPKPEDKPELDTGNGSGSGLNSGIMTINDYDLSFTADDSGKWWFNVRVYGSYLSNNIEHYKFSTKDKKDIPNNYFSLQMVNSERTWAYFTQRATTGHEELYKWLKEQYNKRDYRSVVVSPVRNDIKIEVPSKPPVTEQEPKITTFSLSKTNYGNYVERSIVVNGQYLSSKWDQYELTWKDGNNTTTIPNHLFRNSQFNDGVNYQVFRLSQNADQKFVEEFDRLLKLNNQGTQVFELKLKENK